MKRALAVILVVILLVTCLAGCGKKYKWMNYDFSEYVELCDYKSIDFDHNSDEFLKMLDEYIKNILTTAGLGKDTEIKDGIVATGDKTVIDFVGRIDGKTFEGGSSDDFELTIGSGQFIEGFESGLIGAKVGEKRVLKLKFPANYNPQYAGKNVEFTVTVDKIIRKTYPEVDNEIAKSLGFADLSAFQTEAFAATLSNFVVNKVVSGSKIISYPDDAIETLVQVSVDNITKYCESQGTTFKAYLANYKLTESDYRKQMAEDESMLEALKTYIVLYAICDKEELYPDKTEFKKQEEKLLASPNSVLNMLGDKTQPIMIETTIVTQAVTDFLADSVNNVSDTVSDSSAQ